MEKEYPEPVANDPLSEHEPIVWRVFENAAFDSSKHTAVITGYHDGKMASIFVEVDVSTDSLNLILGD